MLGYGGGRGKQQQAHSSEEELGFWGDGAAADAAKRLSQPQSQCPWQRIKWTDSMVRLLIWVVHSVGEEAAVGDCGEQQQKGKKVSEAPAGTQQKKGKWKSASRTMMEKGFYISPQQCEDKFNDLNKRYKRLNELVGKETACTLADNPALLDSFAGRLPNKSIEEARKLLSSKHLFFREMFAFHNASPVPLAAGPAAIQKGTGGEDGHQHEYFYVAESEEGEEDYNGESDEEDENGNGIFADGRGGGRLVKRKAAMWPEVSQPLSLTLSSPCGRSPPAPMQQVKREMIGLLGERQQRQWLRMRAAELEEQRVVYQRRSLQLERQRFRWLRFSGNKELEMERARLLNERRRLENDRLLLLLQQKEFALFETASNGDAV